MRLLRYILRRLLFIIPVVLGAIFIAFLLTRVVPGNPIERVAGPYASDEELARLKSEAYLDRSVPEQFVIYIRQLLKGDMGVSYNTAQPVTEDLGERFPASAELVLYAMALAILLAIPLGVISAVKRGTWVDHLARVLAVIGVSAPIFWIGLVLLQIFYVRLEWLPGSQGRLPIGYMEPEHITGFYTIDAALTGNWPVLKDAVRALILPVVTLAVVSMAPIARMTRATMIDAMESDYVRTAKSLGLPNHRIIFEHALKNAMLPVLTLIAAVIGYAIGGEVLIELIYSWPGLGLYSYNAIMSADFPAVQGFIILATTLYILIYLLVDVITALLDPRVEY
ncbi:MAG: ABC transporter permease [Thermomicrobiales bacterium]